MANDVRIGLTADDDGVIKTLDDVKKATQEVNKAIDESREAKRKEVQQSRELAAALKAEAEAEKSAATARRQAVAARNSHEGMGDAGAAGLFAEHQLRIQSILQRDSSSIQAIMDARLARETAAVNAKEARGIAEAGTDEAFSAGMNGLTAFSAFIGGGTLLQTFSEFVSYLNDVNQALSAFGNSADQSTRGLRDFQSINPGKEGRDFVRDTVLKGVGAGMTPEQSGAMGATIQASVDRDGVKGLSEDERKAFEESMRVSGNLVNLGVAPEDTQKVIAGAPARGLSAKRMSNIFMTAAEASTSMVPADMAKMMSATGQYSSAEAGFSAATAISEEERDPGRVMEKVRSAQRALGPGADSTKFTKRLGLKGMSESERIDAIAQYFIQNGDQNLSEDQRIDAGTRTLGDTKKFGLDIEEAQSVGMLVRQRGKFKNTLAEMQAMPEGKDRAQELFSGLMEDPNSVGEFQGRVTAAKAKADPLYGVNAQGVQDEKRMRRDAGEVLLATGNVQGVDPATGESTQTWGQRAINRVAFGAGRLLASTYGDTEQLDNPFSTNIEGRAVAGQTKRMQEGGGGAGAGSGTGAQVERLNANLEALNKQLETNTATTAENTAATAATPAQPVYEPDNSEDYPSPAAMKARRADRNGNQ